MSVAANILSLFHSNLCADEDHQEEDPHDNKLLLHCSKTLLKLLSLSLVNTTYLHGNHKSMEQVYTAVLARTLDR